MKTWDGKAGSKFCRGCNAELEIGLFVGVVNHKVYSRCRTCRSRDNQTYKAKKPDYYRQINKTWQESHRAGCRENTRNSYYRHRQDNLEVRRERARRYQHQHLDLFRASNQARRARQLKAPGKLSRPESKEVFRLSYGRCAYCYRQMDYLTLDHIVPLVSGGEHSVENVVATCPRCNSSKKSKSLLVWLLSPGSPYQTGHGG